MSLRSILNRANSTTIKDKLDEFVRNGGDINAQFGRNKDTYLMFYIVANQPDIAKILVEHPNINVNVRDTTGSTALNLAVSEPDMLPVIKLLIEKGANIDNADTMGETPLMLATLSDNKEIVEFLVDSGADKTVKNKRAQTAYDIAKEEGNNTLYDLLRLEGDNHHNNNNNRSNSEPSLNAVNINVQPRRNPIPEDSNIIIENTIEVFDLEAGEDISVTY
jgi:ankyrin repeat protein